ncbi:MAG: hypothetical protein SFY95_01200 [Planctomycetota bacterium]|nr:hypothetical protein [Planctomycetota bacterium]
MINPLTRLASLDRTRARGVTRGAQIGVVALIGLSALLVWAGPPATVKPAEPGTGTGGGAGPAQPLEPPVPAAPKVDFAGTQERLSLIANNPKPAAVAPPTDSGQTPEPPSPTVTLAERVRFLGAYRAGGTMMALLSIDGKQKIVGVGEPLHGDPSKGELTVSLAAVNANEARFEGEDLKEPAKIGKSVRSGPAVTIVAPAQNAGGAMTPGAVQNAPPGVAQGAQGMANFANMTPEQRAQYFRDRRNRRNSNGNGGSNP